MSETKVQDAYGYQFYLERLEDPGLLDRAVVTEYGDLAVPVGGKRHGGYVAAPTRAAGRLLVRQLATRPDDFPAVRLVNYNPWVVEWGPEVDWRGDGNLIPGDHVAAGRLFGYTEEAIAAYGRERGLDKTAPDLGEGCPAGHPSGRLWKPPVSVEQAKVRVLYQMDHFEDSCTIGLDIGYAVRLLDEAIDDYWDMWLRGKVDEERYVKIAALEAETAAIKAKIRERDARITALQAEVIVAEAMRDLEDGAE